MIIDANPCLVHISTYLVLLQITVSYEEENFKPTFHFVIALLIKLTKSSICMTEKNHRKEKDVEVFLDKFLLF